MANKTEFLDALIDCAEDGLKTIQRAASAKGASWSPDDRKALKEWSEALSSLTTVKAMREAEDRGDWGNSAAYGMMPDYYRHGYGDDWAGVNMRPRGGVRSTAYGIGSDDTRRRVISELTRLRDAAPDEHTRIEYARMLSHEYGVT